MKNFTLSLPFYLQKIRNFLFLSRVASLHNIIAIWE